MFFFSDIFLICCFVLCWWPAHRRCKFLGKWQRFEAVFRFLFNSQGVCSDAILILFTLQIVSLFLWVWFLLLLLSSGFCYHRAIIPSEWNPLCSELTLDNDVDDNEMCPYCPKWVTIQNATIFDLQVKNIDFQFSSKLGASGIFLFENITFNCQMWRFMTVSGISNCNCCNTVVCETNFLGPVSQNGTIYGSQIDLSITFEPVGRFA